jgi:predicted nucleic-acid-binding protein
MQGLDTNVLVRFLLRDDRGQAERAKAAIERAVAAEEMLLVSLQTLLETEWVLRAGGGFEKSAIIAAFRLLLETRELHIENEEAVEQAVYTFENSGADFADCLVLAQYQRLGCRSMLTFDKRAARLPGGELVPV